MFVPVFLYGLLAGLAYQLISRSIHHEELRSGLLAVIFWLSLYLFERSWVKTIGLFGTLVVYLGGPALLFDYYLTRGDVIIVEHEEDPPEEGEWI
jgi:NhaP-type Na+/H+ and K+/H+ antiporter